MENELSSLVFDEGKVVSYPWLARESTLTVVEAKRALEAFRKSNEARLDVKVLVQGIASDGGRVACVVSAAKVKEVIDQLQDGANVCTYAVANGAAGAEASEAAVVAPSVALAHSLSLEDSERGRAFRTNAASSLAFDGAHRRDGRDLGEAPTTALALAPPPRAAPPVSKRDSKSAGAAAVSKAPIKAPSKAPSKAAGFFGGGAVKKSASAKGVSKPKRTGTLGFSRSASAGKPAPNTASRKVSVKKEVSKPRGGVVESDSEEEADEAMEGESRMHARVDMEREADERAREEAEAQQAKQASAATAAAMRAAGAEDEEDEDEAALQAEAAARRKAAAAEAADREADEQARKDAAKVLGYDPDAKEKEEEEEEQKQAEEQAEEGTKRKRRTKKQIEVARAAASMDESVFAAFHQEDDGDAPDAAKPAPRPDQPECPPGKKLVKKSEMVTFTDQDGYTVTEERSVWVAVDIDPEEERRLAAAKARREAARAERAAAKPKKKGKARAKGQGALTSFFGKK